MVTVAVDAGGADLGPREVAAGASRAAADGTRVLLFGPAKEIGRVHEGVEVVDAPVSIAKQADPAHAVRTTPEASIVQATRAVAEGRAQAFVSGGSTGSALAAALLHLRRDRGVYRPALALPLPNPDGPPILLLDVGANATCRPEHLVQFAHMGSAFAQAVIGIPTPRVALLSNGEEPGKGTPDLVGVHEQLAGSRGAGLELHRQHRGHAGLRGRGRRRGHGRLHRQHHAEADRGRVRPRPASVGEMAATTPRGRLGARLIAPTMRRLRETIDPEGPGGAYMLGLRHLGVVAHGRFSARGFAQAIDVAARGVQHDVIGRTRAALLEAGALRPPRLGSVPADDPDGPTGEPGGSSAPAATVSTS